MIPRPRQRFIYKFTRQHDLDNEYRENMIWIMKLTKFQMLQIL
jgi:hypothetical protein